MKIQKKRADKTTDSKIVRSGSAVINPPVGGIPFIDSLVSQQKSKLTNSNSETKSEGVVQRMIELEKQTKESIRKKLWEEIENSKGVSPLKGTDYGREIDEARGLWLRVEWGQEQKDRAIKLIRSLRGYEKGKVTPTVAVHMKKRT